MNMILVDGEEVCPICERDKEIVLLSQIESEKYQRSLNRQKYNALMTKSVLDDEDLLSASFANYKTSAEEEVVNKQRAVEAFQNYKKGEVFNTWFTGLPGVGKSHLGMGILRNLNESGQQDKVCVFVSVPKMLLMIRDSYDNKEFKYTESYFINLLSDADYIVLDDLGAETGATGTTKKASDFTIRVLYAVANARQSKSTLITTNLSKSELTYMYDAKLVSRLMKDIYPIHFLETTDKRIKEKKF